MFRKETTGAKHLHKTDGDNITINGSERGTSKAYTLERLKDERPDLFARVVAGERSFKQRCNIVC
jgi:hypothetical protein